MIVESAHLLSFLITTSSNASVLMECILCFEIQKLNMHAIMSMSTTY